MNGIEDMEQQATDLQGRARREHVMPG